MTLLTVRAKPVMIFFGDLFTSQKKYFSLVFRVLPCVLMSALCCAADLSGELHLANRFFLETTSSEPKDYSSTFRPELELGYETALGQHWNVLFSGSFAHDEYDRHRRVADIDELFFRYTAHNTDVSLGFLTEFWGVAESIHLVNVINQRNIADNIDGESTLGQPAVKIQSHFEWGSLQLFWMPVFRERIFPDARGRPATQLLIADDVVRYESDEKEHHQDYAIRYSHTLGGWDVGVSYFQGTEREPVLNAELMPDSSVQLVPWYRQVRQPSLDVQYTNAGLLLKWEGIYRDYRQDGASDSHALVTGFEYTHSALWGSDIDMGYLAEYLYDKRGEDETPFADDIFLALRTALNNVSQSVILTGVYLDRETLSRAWRVEYETRLQDGLTFEIEGQWFNNQSRDSLLYDFRHDDYIELGLTWYF